MRVNKQPIGGEVLYFYLGWTNGSSKGGVTVSIYLPVDPMGAAWRGLFMFLRDRRTFARVEFVKNATKSCAAPLLCV